MANPALPTEIPGARLIAGDDINAIVAWLRGTQSFTTPNDSGATQTLTAAAISNAGSAQVYHRSTGGSTPTLTFPTVAQVLANLPDAVTNSSYDLRVINNNSGTATIALPTGGGWTSSGTLTLATNTWRDFIITFTNVGAAVPTATITSVGTGTDS